MTPSRTCGRIALLAIGIEGVLFYQRRQTESDILSKAPPIRQGIGSRQSSAATAKPDGGLAMSKLIPLTRGKFAIVDDGDFEWLNRRKWRYDGRYAVRSIWKNGKDKTTYMHRIILNTPPGLQSDHMSGDRLDNRRCNLRICTSSQHHANRRKQPGYTSQYKGVRWSAKWNKWRAQIYCGGKSLHLGGFDEEYAAARAYDIAAIRYFGEFARLNFAREAK